MTNSEIENENDVVDRCQVQRSDLSDRILCTQEGYTMNRRSGKRQLGSEPRAIATRAPKKHTRLWAACAQKRPPQLRNDQN